MTVRIEISKILQNAGAKLRIEIWPAKSTHIRFRIKITTNPRIDHRLELNSLVRLTVRLT